MSVNRFLSSPPSSVDVDGITYNINTNFKNAILSWKYLEEYKNKEFLEFFNGDENKANLLLNSVLIDTLYLEPKPDILCEPCLKLISDYLNYFSNNEDDESKIKSKMPPYGYLAIEQDSAMLYGSFLKIGINIRNENLTYEDFLALLPNLPEDCEYRQIMSLRSEWYDNPPKDKKQREALKKRVNHIGKNKVLIKTKESLKVKEEQNKIDDLQEKMKQAYLECKKNNTEYKDGICCRDICEFSISDNKRCRKL